MFLNPIKKYAGLLLGLTLATSCLQTQAQDGIYITVTGGWANQPGLPSAATVGASNRSQPAFPAAIRAAIGYNHDFCKWFGFGFEIGPGYYGDTKYTLPAGTAKISSQTLEFLANFMFHLTPKFDTFITAGAIRHTTKISGAISLTNRTRIQPEIGIGGNYNLSKHWAITASYNRTIGENLTTITSVQLNEPSLNEFLAGLRFTFS